MKPLKPQFYNNLQLKYIDIDAFIYTILTKNYDLDLKKY